MRVALIALLIACGVVIKFWFFQPATSDSNKSTTASTVVVEPSVLSNTKQSEESFNGVLTLPTPTKLLDTPEQAASETAAQKTTVDNTAKAETDEAKTTIASKKVIRKIPILQGKQPAKKAKSKTKSTVPQSVNTLFEKMGSSSQFFTFSNIQNNVLRGKKGTLLSIPENTFVQKDGKTVTGQVTLELKEAFNTSKMLLSNITTNSDYGVVITDGGIYVNVVDEKGKQLVVPKNKSIYVETPTAKRDGKMWVFYAKENTAVAVPKKWVAHQQQTGRLLPFPLKSLHYDKMGLDAKWSERMMSSKYEQTVIATREFRQRLAFILDNKELHGNRISAILGICLQNAKKNLLDIDYKLYKYFKNLHAVAKKEEQKGLSIMQKQFSKYHAEQLTKPFNISTYGLDFDQENAYEVFVGKGFNKKYTSLLLQMNTLQQALTPQLAHQPTLATPSAKNTFLVTKTGWLTIDRFYDKRKKPKALSAVINHQPKNLDVQLYLSFKNFKSVLAGQKKENTYHFVGLPQGEPAYLIGIGYQHGQPYVDVVNLTVGQQEKVDLNMRPTTLDMLTYQISKLDYHHL